MRFQLKCKHGQWRLFDLPLSLQCTDITATPVPPLISELFGTDFHGTLVDLILQLLGVVAIFVMQNMWELRASDTQSWIQLKRIIRSTRKGRVQPIVGAKYGDTASDIQLDPVEAAGQWGRPKAPARGAFQNPSGRHHRAVSQKETGWMDHRI